MSFKAKRRREGPINAPAKTSVGPREGDFEVDNLDDLENVIWENKQNMLVKT